MREFLGSGFLARQIKVGKSIQYVVEKFYGVCRYNSKEKEAIFTKEKDCKEYCKELNKKILYGNDELTINSEQQELL